tara:strand:+ start:231 stop:1157 length:927 start_codon:yes stop_codon:yes gene_type:complete
MANTYAKVSGTFEEIDNAYGKVSGVWQEADEIYGKVSGVWKLVFAAFQSGSVQTLSSGSGTFTVPQGANAIHIQAGVGGGGGAVGGADYDKAGGESAGAGGGSGAYVSDKVFSVTQGETISYSIGTGGSGGGKGFNVTASGGASTTLSGSTAGAIFTLGAGGGSSGTGGGVQGPLRSNTAGTAGSASINGTAITSGTFRDSDGTTKNVTTLTSGPVGSFNQSGNGAVGSNNGNCGGDNCRIGGSTGATSYDGNVAGGSGGSSSGSGTNGTAGTRGSGGGGGAAQVNGGSTIGAAGGSGEVRYRFLRVQ